MGHPRRMFEKGSVYFVTNRTAEGLPFVANAFIRLVTFGILAKACFRFPQIAISCWLFLANHYHSILITRGDPAVFKDFMNYVDGELAKAVVRWLGKRNYKVWAQRYNAARLLTPEAVLQQMSYAYTNPVKANLVARAKDWKGVSTYSTLFDSSDQKFKWVRPSKLSLLPNGAFSRKLCAYLVKKIEELPAPMFTLRVSPFAWKYCFPETSELSDEVLRERLLLLISAEEQQCALERKRDRRTVADPKLLAEQNPHKHYKPKKYGRRVFCISTCAELRREFIAVYRDFCERAQAAWRSLLRGDEQPNFPPGSYLPPSYPVASLLPAFTFR